MGVRVADSRVGCASRLSSSERSTIRKNFDIEDVSEEYKGKVVSRKSLQAFSDEEDDDEDGEDDELEQAADDQMEDDEDEEDGEDDEEDGEDDEDDEDDDKPRAKKGSAASMLAEGLSEQQLQVQAQLAALEEEDEASSSLFAPRGSASSGVASASASSQYTKSTHVKNQLAWYTHLLNLRIRVQGILANSNRLPAETDGALEVRRAFIEQDAEVRPAYAAAFNGAGQLLEDLFALQTGLMQQNTKIFAPTTTEEEDDEGATPTIPQFTGVGVKRKHDGDEADDDDTEAALDDQEQKAEAALDAYWEYMNSTLTPFFRPIQDALIDKWNTKTQLSAGQLSSAGGVSSRGVPLAQDKKGLKVINQSVLAQIDAIMLDEPRLVKRAQLHRATGDASSLLGRVTRAQAKDLQAKKKTKRAADELDSHLLDGQYAEEYDASIYDDNDYYQQLLAEIISQASADAGDADLLNKAAAARKKTRKGGAAVDRRASKGRKMRYTVHPKLTNFMAPKPAPITDDFAEDANANRLSGSGFAMSELFMNLFGGATKA